MYNRFNLLKQEEFVEKNQLKIHIFQEHLQIEKIRALSIEQNLAINLIKLK